VGGTLATEKNELDILGLFRHVPSTAFVMKGHGFFTGCLRSYQRRMKKRGGRGKGIAARRCRVAILELEDEDHGYVV
jgi:hypothetical protein